MSKTYREQKEKFLSSKANRKSLKSDYSSESNLFLNHDMIKHYCNFLKLKLKLKLKLFLKLFINNVQT